LAVHLSDSWSEVRVIRVYEQVDYQLNGLDCRVRVGDLVRDTLCLSGYQLIQQS
jgi:hypothetical protein